MMNDLAHGQAMARINALIDENSFVEIGSMVTARATDFNMQSKDTPSDGVITGYGLIDGSLVYVYSQDASVLGGAIGEMHARKILRVYEMAVKVGAPVIALVDCAGVRLQEAMDSLNAFGEIYESGKGFRCYTPDYGSIWNLRRRHGNIGRNVRFYICCKRRQAFY